MSPRDAPAGAEQLALADGISRSRDRQLNSPTRVGSWDLLLLLPGDSPCARSRGTLFRARMANAARRRFLLRRFVPHGRCAIQRNGRASGMEELTTRICSLHAAVSGSQPDAPHRPKYCTSIFQRLILSIEKKKAKSKPWAAATLCDRLQVVHRNRRSVPLPTQHNRWSKACITIDSIMPS